MPKPKKTKRPLLKRLTKRPTIFALVGILLIGAGLGYLQLKGSRPASETIADTLESPRSGDYVNLNPPTEQDKKDAEENKKALVEEPGTPAPPTSDGKKQVTPEIISADRLEVRAHVPGIFEDGGTCTATATNGSQTEAATSSGFANYSDTQCEPMNWSLPSGGWLVVVSYSSGTAKGSSEAFVVN